MGDRLGKRFYITEPKFGFERYRKPIVWFDKLLIVGGILAGIAGRLLAAVWVILILVAPMSRANSTILTPGISIHSRSCRFCR